MATTFYNLVEVEKLAKDVMEVQAYDYISGGSESMFSMNENRLSFSRLKLLPRLLRDVSKIDMSCNILGVQSSMPVWIAPMAMHGLCHPDRELGTAKAATAAGVPYVFSTVATSSMQEIAQTGHDNTVFQLYVIRDRGVVEQWVRTAESLGFKALMVTVDAQRLGRREADERNRFTLPAHLKLKNLELLSTGSCASQARASTQGSGLTTLFAQEVDDSLTWDFVPWLKSITKLPVIIKGLLAAEDVQIALDAGVDGIAVSNHGGRQLDFAPSALEVLPAIVKAVNKRVPVFMDGGIRRGTDVLKALALGANCVLLGRPVLYGLALAGQEGVERVIGILKSELELGMALAGCPSLAHIGPELILPPQPHPHALLLDVPSSQPHEPLQRGITRATTACECVEHDATSCWQPVSEENHQAVGQCGRRGGASAMKAIRGEVGSTGSATTIQVSENPRQACQAEKCPACGGCSQHNANDGSSSMDPRACAPLVTPVQRNVSGAASRPTAKL